MLVSSKLLIISCSDLLPISSLKFKIISVVKFDADCALFSYCSFNCISLFLMIAMVLKVSMVIESVIFLFAIITLMSIGEHFSSTMPIKIRLSICSSFDSDLDTSTSFSSESALHMTCMARAFFLCLNPLDCLWLRSCPHFFLQTWKKLETISNGMSFSMIRKTHHILIFSFTLLIIFSLKL
jgi:hypothetical protein